MSAALVAVVPSWPKALDVALVIVVTSLGATPAFAAPIWNVEVQPLPTAFQSSDTSHGESQVLEVAASGEDYSLTFEGQTTGALATSAAPQEIESALTSLSTVSGAGLTVAVEGVDEPFSEPFRIRDAISITGASAADGVPLIAVVGSSATVTSATNDAYNIGVQNIGTTSSSGAVVVEDLLPEGITTTETPYEDEFHGSVEWSCSPGAGQSVVRCQSTKAVGPASGTYDSALPGNPDPIEIPVTVSAGTAGELSNTVTVSGGGATRALSSSSANPVNMASALTSFGPGLLSFVVAGSDGSPFTVAGGHPYAVTADFGIRREVTPGATEAANEQGAGYQNGSGGDELRTVVAELPLGLVGNPQATARCPMAEFVDVKNENTNGCLANTRVGVVNLARPALGAQTYQLFNLVPEPGHAAEFGFSTQSFAIVFYGDVIPSGRGYVLRVTALAPEATITGVSATFFGDPASVFATGAPETAFLSMPTDCGSSEAARSLLLNVDSWAHPGEGDPFNPNFSDPNWVPASATLPSVEGCGALTFNPFLSFQPASEAEGGTTKTDEPSGYNVDLEVPQNEEYSKLATPEIKTTKVTLPAGLSVSPSAAGGMEVCSNGQIALDSNDPGSCPLGSQIGTVKITTPLLEEALDGEVFLGTPECGSPGLCTESDGSEGKTFRLFIQVHSEKLGITIKLPGKVKANPSNGQLTAEFAENPQLPFSDLELHFKSGPRAPLANPQTCGTFTTVSSLEPWSAPETPTATSESLFAVAGCGSSLPFAPNFTAGMASSVSAQSSTFSVSFGRNDGEQNLGSITVHAPPGLLERMEGVAKCGEVEANAGTCPAASQIGTTTVSAGPGSNPYTIAGGEVYLTGPYKGAPFGLAVVVPAEAGPFKLAGNTGRGLEVVRAAIAVNPTTAALTVASDPLPQIIDGVPIRLRTVNVEINRSGFMLSPTSCAPGSITATLTGEHPIGSGEGDKTSAVSAPYAVSGCGSLPFKPSFGAFTSAKVSKVGGASLNVKIAQNRGEANVRRVDVQLPKMLPARLIPTLQNACTEEQFAANPAGCPADSFVGTATAVTPSLSVPLTGPAIFVSHGGEAFPDIDIVLQGEGVTIDLTGHTQIKNAITYSRFESVPDAPISSFELNLPEGPHSAVSAPTAGGSSLCGHTLIMPTAIEGQNGAMFKQTTKIAVAGCAPLKPKIEILGVKLCDGKLVLRIKTTERGRTRIAGHGIKTAVGKQVLGTHTFAIALTKAGIRAARGHRKIKLTLSLRVGKQTTTKTTRVKL